MPPQVVDRAEDLSLSSGPPSRARLSAAVEWQRDPAIRFDHDAANAALAKIKDQRSTCRHRTAACDAVDVQAKPRVDAKSMLRVLASTCQRLRQDVEAEGAHHEISRNAQ